MSNQHSTSDVNHIKITSQNKTKINGQRWITVESVYFNQKGLPLQIMVIQN